MLYISSADGLGKFTVTNDIDNSSTETTLGELREFCKTNYIAGFNSLSSEVLDVNTKEGYYFGDTSGTDVVDAIAFWSENCFSPELSRLFLYTSKGVMYSNANEFFDGVDDGNYTATLCCYDGYNISYDLGATFLSSSSELPKLSNIFLMDKTGTDIPSSEYFSGIRATTLLSKINGYHAFNGKYYIGHHSYVQSVNKNVGKVFFYIAQRLYFADENCFLFLVIANMDNASSTECSMSFARFMNVERDKVFSGLGFIMSMDEIFDLQSNGHSFINATITSSYITYTGLDGTIYIDMERYNKGHKLYQDRDNAKFSAIRKITTGDSGDIDLRADGVLTSFGSVDGKVVLPNNTKYIVSSCFNCISGNVNCIDYVYLPKSFEGCFSSGDFSSPLMTANFNNFYKFTKYKRSDQCDLSITAKCSYNALISFLLNMTSIFSMFSFNLVKDSNIFDIIGKFRFNNNSDRDTVLRFMTLNNFGINNYVVSNMLYVFVSVNGVPDLIFSTGLSKMDAFYAYTESRQKYLGNSRVFNNLCDTLGIFIDSFNISVDEIVSRLSRSNIFNFSFNGFDSILNSMDKQNLRLTFDRVILDHSLIDLPSIPLITYDYSSFSKLWGVSYSDLSCFNRGYKVSCVLFLLLAYIKAYSSRGVDISVLGKYYSDLCLKWGTYMDKIYSEHCNIIDNVAYHVKLD